MKTLEGGFIEVTYKARISLTVLSSVEELSEGLVNKMTIFFSF